MKKIALAVFFALLAGCSSAPKAHRKSDPGTILIHRSSADNFAYTVDLAPMREEIGKIPVGEGVRFLIVGEK